MDSVADFGFSLFGLQMPTLPVCSTRQHVHIFCWDIVQIENGTKVPSLSVLVKIANTLSVSADELLLDCLEYSSSSANSEIHRLLLDCNETEQTVIIRMAKELKAILVSLGV